MRIHSFGQTDVLNVRRLGPSSSPPANGGALAFKAERAGAARADTPGMVSRVGSFLRSLKFWFCPSFTPARSRRSDVVDVPPVHDRLLGNLLSSLMARANDRQVLDRIAKELSQSEQEAEAELLILLRHSRANWTSMKREEGLAGLMQWSKRPDLRRRAKAQSGTWSAQADEQPGVDRNSKPSVPPTEVKFLARSQIADAMARSKAAKAPAPPVPALDADNRARIVRGLTRLSRLTQGDLTGPPAERGSLSARLEAMRYSDLITLRHGILGHWSAREEVLDQVDPELRPQARSVLSQIATALHQRLAGEVVDKPLSRIEKLASSPAARDGELQAELIKLHTSLAMLDSNAGGNHLPAPSMLDVHLQSLPMERAQGLLRALDAGKMKLSDQALSRGEQAPEPPRPVQQFQLDQPQARLMLDRLHGSVKREVQARARSE